MKKLGQHFLKNAEVLQTIIDALAITAGETLIEVGPGHGELTVPLVAVAKKFGCVVTVIEKDHTLIAPLEALAAQQKIDPETSALEIIEGDALKLLPSVISAHLDKNVAATKGASALRAYKIIGNIPYYITGKLLRVISDLKEKPTRSVLMVQKEVAERICAEPPRMNRLAASVQFWADARIIASVPRKDFSPTPEVDSAVIMLSAKPKESIDAQKYYEAVRGIFAQPRKTLLNNLSTMAKGSAPKDAIMRQLQKEGIDPETRPQNLSIAQITAITKIFLP